MFRFAWVAVTLCAPVLAICADAASLCEKTSDHTACHSDLNCSWSVPLQTCHTRADLPKCEELPDYLCMDRSDCGFDSAELLKPKPTCTSHIRQATFDASPSDWERQQEACSQISDPSVCSGRIYCDYQGDKKRCFPRHVPLTSKSVQSSQVASPGVADFSTCQATNSCLNLVVGKNAQGFHIDIAGQKIAVEPLLGDVRVTRLATDDGLLEELFPNGGAPKVSIRRASGIKNAIALIYKGTRLIVHDPMWSTGQRVTGAGLVASQLIFAHELGHHICKHVAGSNQTDPLQNELEADRVSGSILRNAHDTGLSGISSLEHVVHVAAQMYGANATRSHPSRSDRIVAITDGWKNDHACHGR